MKKPGFPVDTSTSMLPNINLTIATETLLATIIKHIMCVCVRLEDGRLLDYLVAHDELMEEKVAFFIRETLEALQHLHTCRVAHLDLKVRSV